MRLLLRPRVLVPLVVVAGVTLAVTLAVFEPWRLFTSTTVVEPAPDQPAPSVGPQSAGTPSTTAIAPGGVASTPPAPRPVTLATGSFVSHEHATTGRVRLIRLANGSAVVRLEGLATSDGPALEVWLTDQPVRADRSGWNVFDDGRYVSLGDLKGNRGDQNYPVPAGTDLRGLTSVSVWCARFHVSFGAAALHP